MVAFQSGGLAKGDEKGKYSEFRPITYSVLPKGDGHVQLSEAGNTQVCKEGGLQGSPG